MEDKEKECLLSYYCELVKRIDVKLILDLLVAKRVICDEQRQLIEAGTTQQNKCRTLIGMLLKSDHPDTFDYFINAMANPYPFLTKALVKKFYELSEKNRPRRIRLSETRNVWKTCFEETQCTEKWTIENPSDSDNECDIDTSKRASDSQTMTEPIDPVEHEDIYNSYIPSEQGLSHGESKCNNEFTSKIRSNLSGESSCSDTGSDNDSQADDGHEMLGSVDNNEIGTSYITRETNGQGIHFCEINPDNKEVNETQKSKKWCLTLPGSVSNVFQLNRRHTSADDNRKNKNKGLERRDGMRRKSLNPADVSMQDQANNQSNNQLLRLKNKSVSAQMERQTISVDLESINHVFGFRFMSGHEQPRWSGDNEYYITKLEPNSAASQCQRIAIGDAIVTINGVSVQDLELNRVMELMKTEKLTLKLKKYILNPRESSIC